MSSISKKRFSKYINFLKAAKKRLLRANATWIMVGFLIVLSFFIGRQSQRLDLLKAGVDIGTSSKESGQYTPDVKSEGKGSGKVPGVTIRDHIRGERSAKVFLVEYADLECPFCKKFHPALNQIVGEYNGQVAWVYRHFPLERHENSQKEAEASECASELGGNDKFWQYVDQIFERTNSDGQGFSLHGLGPLAAEIGIDGSKFENCLNSGKYARHVLDQLAEGRRIGVGGTPATFIVSTSGYSKLIKGALPASDLKAAIDEALKR